MIKYRDEYKWSNIFEMVRNLKVDPQPCAQDFHGRTVVITGATSGIGYATALKYASHGANVLTINRNEAKSAQLCETLTRDYGVTSNYLLADFSRLADVHRVAQHLASMDQPIDVLIHNVGVFMTKKTLTGDGLELVFQTGYVASFILNHYLLNKLKNQQHSRIIYVNSEAYRFAVSGLRQDDLNWEKRRYSGSRSYGAAKCAQLLSMIKLVEYFQGSGVTVNAMHPGNVKTNSGQGNGRLYNFLKQILVESTAKSTDISAEALYYLGVSGDVADTTGKFFHLTTEESLAPPALDRDAADELWEHSLVLAGLEHLQTQ